jgi:chaperonin GroEL
MAKQLKYAEDARQILKRGVDQVARAIRPTLGPKGRTVALDRKWGAPNIVNDGAIVAKDIEVKDPFENMGVQLAKEVASKTADVVGDGTTTATLLLQSLVSEGLRNITAGTNPVVLRRGIEKGVKAVVSELEKMAKPVKGKEEIAQVATISAAEPQVGNLIAEALEKVGKDGVVTVEEGKGLVTEVEYKEGMEFDKGYASPYFVTIPERMEAEIEEPYILITDKKLSALNELLPFLEKLVKISKSVVIIADEIEGEALATLVVNKIRGTFNCLAIKAPGFGDRRKAMLSDIAILTGGTVISEDMGRKLDSVTLEDCGRAEKVWANKENCRIIGGKGDVAKIKARIAQIKREIEETTSDFDREKLEERLAKLSGGVAVLNVGAATEPEMKEKKERVLDAVAATKAAIEEGIVAGGGVALLRAKKALGKTKDLEGEEKVGVEILLRVLEEPIRQILNNSGVDEGYWVREVEKTKDSEMGYNVLSDQMVNMFEVGIVDPVKVTRTALQNAASTAAVILTTDVLVTDIPEKEETPPIPGGGPGPGY